MSVKRVKAVIDIKWEERIDKEIEPERPRSNGSPSITQQKIMTPNLCNPEH